MPLISTDYRDYLESGGPLTRARVGHTLARAVEPIRRIVACSLVCLGLTLVAWGAGLDSASWLAVLVGYPLAEFLEWLSRLLHERGHGGRAIT